MVCCYNAKHNDPYKDSRLPRYTPLEKVADGAIKQVGVTRFAFRERSGRRFLAAGPVKPK